MKVDAHMAINIWEVMEVGQTLEEDLHDNWYPSQLAPLICLNDCSGDRDKDVGNKETSVDGCKNKSILVLLERVIER